MNKFGIKVKGIVKNNDKFLILRKWYDDRITVAHLPNMIRIRFCVLPIEGKIFVIRRYSGMLREING